MYSRARVLIGITMLALNAAIGCRSYSISETYKCQDWKAEFFSLSTTEQMIKFQTYGIEEQYKIYICGNEYYHPPHLHLATSFAAGGDRAAKVLKAALERTTDDAITADIFAVFREMHRKSTYNFTSDIELIDLMVKRIREVKDPHWKQYSLKVMSEISK